MGWRRRTGCGREDNTWASCARSGRCPPVPVPGWMVSGPVWGGEKQHDHVVSSYRGKLLLRQQPAGTRRAARSQIITKPCQEHSGGSAPLHVPSAQRTHSSHTPRSTHSIPTPHSPIYTPIFFQSLSLPPWFGEEWGGGRLQRSSPQLFLHCMAENGRKRKVSLSGDNLRLLSIN